MRERAFYAAEVKAKAMEAVRAVEAQTSAEVVIALRPSSDRYRAATYLAGAIVGLFALTALLVLPRAYPLYAFPLDVALGFVAGTLVASRSVVLRRALTPRVDRADAVRRAARAAFVELGVSRTRGRTGLLVYVSMLEKRVELVADVGLDDASIDRALRDAAAPLERAIASRDVEGFVASLRALGPVLGAALPRAEDDENELPDDVDGGEAEA
jgi:putative membrane protein